jgi:DNA-binding response OmpR family regulator
MGMKFENTKALIVDDEPHIRELLCRFLKPEGCECLRAGSGEEALALLEGQDFDLIISDIMMPGMSGVDLLNVVTKYHPDAAVILVTAVDDADTGMMAVEMGAYGYIIKPFTKSQILVDVASALKRRGEKIGAKTDNPAVNETETEISHIEASESPSVQAIVDSLRSGKDDFELMEQFQLRAKTLQDLLEQLVSRGLLDKEELEARTDKLAKSVALGVSVHRDRHKQSEERWGRLGGGDGLPLHPNRAQSRLKPGELLPLGGNGASLENSDAMKANISATDAVKCIRSGMNDLQLMKRYNISAMGLKSLFRKLINEGYLKPEHFYGASPSCHEIILERDIPPRFLALAVSVYEAKNGSNRGFLTQIDEKGLNVTGIEAGPGAKKTLRINPGGIIDSEDIWMDAVCVAYDENGPEGMPVAGFQIRNISRESLENFTKLVKALSFQDIPQKLSGK